MTFWFAATFSQILASHCNSGGSLQMIWQILYSLSISSLQNTPCLAGILLTPYDARLVTAPRKHLQACIIDALSSAGSVIHSDTNLHKISMSSAITVHGNWLNLWKKSVISSHTSHLLSFVAEGRHNIKSCDCWRRECPCSSVAQWRRTVHGQESIFCADLATCNSQLVLTSLSESWHHTDWLLCK